MVCDLESAFHKLYPQVTFHNVVQPASNYFTLMQTANVAHTGPDIEQAITGFNEEQNGPAFVKLNNVLSGATQHSIYELPYSSLNYQPKDGIVIAPVATQAYIGFYNTSLFQKVGIASLPQDWSQLYADCSKLKAIGVTPIEYGNLNLGSPEFYVAMDLSYLLAGVLTPPQWDQLYAGTLAWNSPTIIQQIAAWHKLFTLGCVNSNALTENSPLQVFESGKAAMIADVTPVTFPPAVSKRTGVMPLPYNPKPEKTLVFMSGFGLGATSYGSHVADATAFLKFVDSKQGQTIVGQLADPAISGVASSYANTNPMEKDLVDWAASGTYRLYPFIDNVSQGAVYTTLQTVLPVTMVGQTSPKSAMDSVEKTELSLPSSERRL
jgi:ABC-type glycerol-3-phosphate transport system substrate-binding protein